MSDIKSLLLTDFNRIDASSLSDIRRQWAKKLGGLVRNSDILLAYRQLIQDKKIKPNPALEKLLQTRGTRTLSGVTPFAVMTKPFPCPGRCIYCPLEVGMPKSYLSDEPAAQRAKQLNFDPTDQVKIRLEQLIATGHPVDKIELIVIGGTFSAYPYDYKLNFFKAIFDACNKVPSDNLEQAQKINESSPHRIVGISIETRPDKITPEEVKFLRFLGVTKIQLGVQAFDDQILADIGRDHSLQTVTDATRMLRNAGFKICYHFMPDLPGSSPQKDIHMAKTMYTDPRFIPDFVKIYPCVVIPGTELYRRFQKGDYHSYSDKELLETLLQIKLITPPYVRIDRLVRDISKQWVASGVKTTNIRQLLSELLRKEGKNCQCIRCREVKSRDYTSLPDLVVRKNKTLGGDEYFLSFEKDNQLYSLLRLRLPAKDEDILFDSLNNAGIIREVHTFGVASALHSRRQKQTQHQGLGKLLVAKAEEIAKQNNYHSLAVISAIGTRPYFASLGYRLKDSYMVKEI